MIDFQQKKVLSQIRCTTPIFGPRYLGRAKGEMEFKCLDILMIRISFERVFDADQQSYNNHMLKINMFPDISITSKKNDVTDYVMTKVNLSKYVFHAYHSQGNLTLINNHMSFVYSISIFSR